MSLSCRHCVTETLNSCGPDAPRGSQPRRGPADRGDARRAGTGAGRRLDSLYLQPARDGSLQTYPTRGSCPHYYHTTRQSVGIGAALQARHVPYMRRRARTRPHLVDSWLLVVDLASSGARALGHLVVQGLLLLVERLARPPRLGAHVGDAQARAGRREHRLLEVLLPRSSTLWRSGASPCAACSGAAPLSVPKRGPKFALHVTSALFLGFRARSGEQLRGLAAFAGEHKLSHVEATWVA